MNIQKEREAQMENLKKKENELTLKQAKLAWANGEELQIDSGGGFYDLTGDYCLFAFDHPSNKFRIKPKSITLNGIEVPAPFEPKNNQQIWVLDTQALCGYKSIIHHIGCKHDLCWETEKQTQQVVAALRSAFFHA